MSSRLTSKQQPKRHLSASLMTAKVGLPNLAKRRLVGIGESSGVASYLDKSRADRWRGKAMLLMPPSVSL